jgi:hypothetical protein
MSLNSQKNLKKHLKGQKCGNADLIISVTVQQIGLVISANCVQESLINLDMLLIYKKN